MSNSGVGSTTNAPGKSAAATAITGKARTKSLRAKPESDMENSFGGRDYSHSLMEPECTKSAAAVKLPAVAFERWPVGVLVTGVGQPVLPYRLIGAGEGRDMAATFKHR
jgi:hypothetical protein